MSPPWSQLVIATTLRRHVSSRNAGLPRWPRLTAPSSPRPSSLCRPCAACHVESWSFPSRSFFLSFFGPFFFFAFLVISWGSIAVLWLYWHVMSCFFFLLFFFLFSFFFLSLPFVIFGFSCYVMPCALFRLSLLSSFGFLSCLRTLKASLGLLLISIMSAYLEILFWRPFDFCHVCGL